ncbi:MAG: hypothetical protein K0Q72_4256 [Armatimonadetes bacterium]|nr:hypothetical protein [Armatimonadota bacterium]
MPDEEPLRLERRSGRLIACTAVRGDCSEWQVDLDGSPETAIAYGSLAGPLQAGDLVWLNTTAVSLSLGTGGAHFVIARLDQNPSSDVYPTFTSRDAGHILKLRYTPLQLRVCAAEEEVSPHRAALEAFRSLDGAPVVAAELLSQAGAAAVAARAAAPGARIVLVHLDSAALPLAFSGLIHRLRADGVLDATVTVGQSFGGDLEAINVYSGLAVARAAAGADLILVTQGPGNAGTGTELGFSGLAVVEALHAADLLGGRPILIPRLSEAEARARHQGLSHHTATILRSLRVPVTVPVADPHPPGFPNGVGVEHRTEVTEPDSSWAAIERYRDVLVSMGRTLDQDRLFFRTTAAAGVFAARLSGR